VSWRGRFQGKGERGGRPIKVHIIRTSGNEKKKASGGKKLEEVSGLWRGGENKTVKQESIAGAVFEVNKNRKSRDVAFLKESHSVEKRTVRLGLQQQKKKSKGRRSVIRPHQAV